MARAAFYECSACGARLARWHGQCPQCGAWNALKEAAASAPLLRAASAVEAAALESELVALTQVERQKLQRITSGITEWDRVLGGGFVPGGVVLLGGDPGVGKSTLLLQALAALMHRGEQRLLYVTGEESVEQVALRADRLGLGKVALPLLAEVRLEVVLGVLRRLRPAVAVIDSIQTLAAAGINSLPGSAGQLRAVVAELTRLAKEERIALVLIGHVTKEGSLAGPKVVEHLVDTVLYFEGDLQSRYRFVRAFKNRFGAIHELGVFVMTAEGLKGVANPSAIFLAERREGVAGSVVLVTLEGTRPLLVELQALVARGEGGAGGRRLALGYDHGRLVMVLAILHRHARLDLSAYDVFVNVVGGVRIDEPAGDLAVAAAILSSFGDVALSPRLVVFGELGLGGEVRPAPFGPERLREAAKLGFSTAWVSRSNVPREALKGFEVRAVEHVAALRAWIGC